MKTWWDRWRRSEDGLSAVEFALFAPTLFFALVASVDVGLAEYQRMTVDHILRAGAQSAMADPGQAEVLDVVQNTASKNFAADALTVDVQRFCACPADTSAAVDCSTTCTGAVPPFIYYRMSGATIYSGMIVPAMTLPSSIQVQVR